VARLINSAVALTAHIGGDARVADVEAELLTVTT
jgi:hypothetical protein